MNEQTRIAVQHFNFYYGSFHALSDLNLPIYENRITALIGPSGCGKSTFLRSLNRMNDQIAGARAEGEIIMDGQNIYAPGVDVTTLRQNIGMVFQRPNPFPQSIYDNVAFGPRVLGITKKQNLDKLIESSLKDASLWSEVKDNLSRTCPGTQSWTAAAIVHSAYNCRQA